MFSSKIKRPAVRYYGGKWKIAPWVINHFPDHVCYVEPFSGAASVLLRKMPSELEIINDLDGEVINFFKVLRERADELVRWIWLTPYARGELAVAYADDRAHFIERLKRKFFKRHWQLERARRFFVRSYLAYGAARAERTTGWRFEKNTSRGRRIVKELIQLDHLFDIAERLKQVQIESDDAFNIFGRFDGPDTLFYVDPPYMPETRSLRWRRNAYTHELNEEGHRKLLELLVGLQGTVVLSGYQNGMYEDLLHDWEVSSRQSMGHKIADELLWVSPNTNSYKKQPRLL